MIRQMLYYGMLTIASYTASEISVKTCSITSLSPWTEGTAQLPGSHTLEEFFKDVQMTAKTWPCSQCQVHYVGTGGVYI